MKTLNDLLKNNDTLLFKRSLLADNYGVQLYGIEVLRNSLVDKSSSFVAKNIGTVLQILQYGLSKEDVFHYQVLKDQLIDQCLKEEELAFFIQKKELSGYYGVMGKGDFDMFQPISEMPIFHGEDLETLFKSVNLYYNKEKEKNYVLSYFK